jgi:hypothetical protein
VKGDHFLDANILVAWLVHYDHHSGKTATYFGAKASRHTSEFVIAEVLGVLGKYRKTAGDFVSNLEATKGNVIGSQNWLVAAVKRTQGGLGGRDRSRVDRIVKAFHLRIAAYQAGTVTADALLAEMIRPLAGGARLLRTQTICQLHHVPRDLSSRYGPISDLLSKVIKNPMDVKVILGAHHLRCGGLGIVPFITLDGTDFLRNAKAIEKVISPIMPVAPDAWLALPR